MIKMKIYIIIKQIFNKNKIHNHYKLKNYHVYLKLINLVHNYIIKNQKFNYS